MNESELIHITQSAIWTAVKISGPTLIVALVVGLVIGLFQALTSIQELTLTFVPKLLAVLLTLWIGADAMAVSLVAFLKNDLVPLMLGS